MTTTQTPRSPWPFRLMALAGALFLQAAAATWFLYPSPKATAQTDIYVAPVRPYILNPVEEKPQDAQDFMEDQMSLVREPVVLRPALNDPEVQKLSMIRQLEGDPIPWMEEIIQVEVVKRKFLRISASGD